MSYPRVTEILNYFTAYDKVPKEVLHKAASRGTTVHALCAGIAKGNWVPESMIEEECRGYVSSFKLWADDWVKCFVVIEKRYQDDICGYTGQVDFVVRLKDGRLMLVDLKTSASKQKTYPVQMAAYRSLLLVNKMKVDGAILVYLKKDGSYPSLHEIEDLSQEHKVFMCALTCWEYFNKKKGAKDVEEKGVPGVQEGELCSEGTVPEVLSKCVVQGEV